MRAGGVYILYLNIIDETRHERLRHLEIAQLARRPIHSPNRQALAGLVSPLQELAASTFSFPLFHSPL